MQHSQLCPAPLGLKSSAVNQVFAIPELFTLILSNLPPSPLEYEVDGPEADDYRSKTISSRAGQVRSLLHASLVSRHWRSHIMTSRPTQEALFLIPSAPNPATVPSLAGESVEPGRGKPVYDSDGRSWTVPPDAPWLVLNRAISAMRFEMQDPFVQQHYLINHPAHHSSRLLGIASSSEGRETHSGSVDTKKGQMYPGRPILNPLLQSGFRQAQFMFNPMHGADSARRYQAFLVVERGDFERWNAEGKVGVQGRTQATAREIERGSDDSSSGMIPSWCHMHLSSPPITSVMMFVWEGGAGGPECAEPSDLQLEDDRAYQESTNRQSDENADPHRTVPIRSVVGAQRQMGRGSTLGSFYSTKQVHQADGLTMGMLMAEIGNMFMNDVQLKAIKVCTQ